MSPFLHFFELEVCAGQTDGQTTPIVRPIRTRVMSK